MLASIVAVSWASAALAQRPLGLDVSAWQGSISQTCWNQIYASGKSFAIIRVTHYGASNGDPDTYYAQNISRARAAGLLVAPYHYAIWSRTPQVEANYFLSYAAPYITTGYLPPMLDLESGGNPPSPTGATSVCDWANQWLNIVKAQTGVDAMIYVSGGSINTYCKAPSGCSCGGTCTCCLVDHPLVDADWCGNNVCTACGDMNTAQPEYGIGFWPKWTFWQYCSTGSVSCISGNVDLDIFNGTLADLQCFVIGGCNQAPVISNVQATGITSTTATITWTTDTAATSQVQYGLTSSYGSSSPLDSTRVTSHSVGLSGLTPNTLYHYRVISTNDYGTTNSSDYTFTTTGPLIITNVAAGNIGADRVTITWTTNVAATSQVKYGLTSGYGSQTLQDSTLVTSHSVTVTGLAANTLYHYQVLSSINTENAHSLDYTFTTGGVPIISNVGAGSITSNSAAITWTTNVLADSLVEYGTTTSYGSSSSDAALVTSHSINVTGLSPTTLYHYRVRSANAAGPAYSGDYTFTTGAVPAEIQIDNLDAGCTTTGSWNHGSAAGVPLIGTDYLYASPSGSQSSTTATCRWTPNIPAAGTYDVYAFYQMGTNRNSAAPYTVVYSGGSLTSIQNQYSSTANQGGWFKLNTTPLAFAAGTAGYVQVANNTAATGYISADAAKFVRVDTQPPTVPTDLAASAVSTSSIQLSWSASSDDTGVSGYKIYRNGGYLASSTVTNYLDSGRTANTSYTYTVSAYDGVPNESAQCTAVARATFSVAPGSTSVTRDASNVCVNSNVVWTASGGFGAGTIQYYRYAWDQAATHTFTGAESQWSSGTLTTSVAALGTWYLHLRGYNVENVANGSYDYAFSNPCRSITQWRSVRTHGGSTSAAIVLDPTASGSGIDGPTVESRSGGIQRIEIDFNAAVTLGNPASVQVTGRTTAGGVLGSQVSYTPTSVSMADVDTMAITFNAGVLPDATCYTIALVPGAIVEQLTGTTSCRVRALVGDVTGNGFVNLGDVMAIRARAGAPLTGNAQFDVDLDGSIAGSDVLMVKTLVSSPARQALCP